MCTSILTKAPGEEGVLRESSAPRERGEREAPEDTKGVRLHRAQELLELLAAVIIHRAHCVRLYPMPQPWMASATVR